MAVLLGQALRLIEHVALAGAGVPLDSHHPVRRRGDELHRGALARGEAARGEPRTDVLGDRDGTCLPSALALDLQDALLALQGGLRREAALDREQRARGDAVVYLSARHLARSAAADECCHPCAPGPAR